jgi:hypothetical protein
MDHATAIEIREVIERATEGDDALLALRADLLALAVHYAHIRAEWRLAVRQERAGMDGTRRQAHNAVIEACDELSHACARAGRDRAWRRALGEDRREIGDFACHLHCLLGIEAR